MQLRNYIQLLCAWNIAASGLLGGIVAKRIGRDHGTTLRAIVTNRDPATAIPLS